MEGGGGEGIWARALRTAAAVAHREEETWEKWSSQESLQWKITPRYLYLSANGRGAPWIVRGGRGGGGFLLFQKTMTADFLLLNWSFQMEAHEEMDMRRV
jgi:hypothetical protein